MKRKNVNVNVNVERKNPEFYLVAQTDDGFADSLQKLLNDPKYSGYKVLQIFSIERSIGSCYTVVFEWIK